MLKNNVLTFIHTQHLGEAIELNDSPAEAADGFVKQKRDIRFVDGAEGIVPWHEVAAVITGNQMSQAPDAEGFCVESGGVTPGERIVVFDGDVTTEYRGGNYGSDPLYMGWGSCSKLPDFATVTVDGILYDIPADPGYGYGVWDTDTDKPDFSTFPVYIEAGPENNFVYTESAGTYNLRIEIDCQGGGPGPK